MPDCGAAISVGICSTAAYVSAWSAIPILQLVKLPDLARLKVGIYRLLFGSFHKTVVHGIRREDISHKLCLSGSHELVFKLNV